MKKLQLPKWKLNELSQSDLYDGDEFLVAVRVCNTSLDNEKWEFEKIRINCDDEFFHIHYFDCCNEAYDTWAWEDFEYYIKLNPKV